MSYFHTRFISGFQGDELLRGLQCVIRCPKAGAGFTGNSSRVKHLAKTIKLISVLFPRGALLWPPRVPAAPAGLAIAALAPGRSSGLGGPLSLLPPSASSFYWDCPLGLSLPGSHPRGTRPQELTRSPLLFKINLSHFESCAILNKPVVDLLFSYGQKP